MLRWLTAGESHGPELIAILEGMPAGVPIGAAAIRAEHARQGKGRPGGAKGRGADDGRSPNSANRGNSGARGSDARGRSTNPVTPADTGAARGNRGRGPRGDPRDARVLRKVFGDRLKITKRLGVQSFSEMAQVQFEPSVAQKICHRCLGQCVGRYRMHPFQADYPFFKLSRHGPPDAESRCQ